MIETEIAERIAREAHAGQVDQHGQPYILHVERVAAAVSQPAKAAAWLHDVIEDCGRRWYLQMRVQGIGEDVFSDVVTLTRIEGEQYASYIENVAEASAIAREIKLADLRDNLRAGCHESLRQRYEAAIQRLDRVSLMKGDS